MADPVNWGSEGLANTEMAGNQERSKVVALHDGGFVAVWQDWSGVGGDTSNSAIKAQVFDAAGAKVGGEILVNTYPDGTQGWPDVAVLDSSKFVIVWQGLGHPDDNSTDGISGQMFESNGQKFESEFLVNTPVGSPNETSQLNPSIAALGTGGFVVVFEDMSPSSEAQLSMQLFDANGAKVGSETSVNTFMTGQHNFADVAAIGPDKFVVTWQEDGQQADDPDGTAVRMRVFENSGNPVTGEKLVSTFTANSQLNPSIQASTNGTFTIAFVDLSQGLDPSGQYIAARVFDSQGDQASPAYVVDDTSNGGQPGEAVLVSLIDGSYLAFWQSYEFGLFKVRGQKLSQAGTRVGDEFVVKAVTVPTDIIDQLQATRLADGRIVVSWTESGGSDADTTGKGISFQIIDPREGIINGSIYDETIYGSAVGSAIVNDIINGRQGNDTIYGLDGNDTITGSDGTDTLYGGIGDDTYTLEDITDKAIELGGQGTDTVKAGFNLLLGAFIEKGELTGIQNFSITGNGLANTLTGNSGNNVLNGGLGLDHLFGGLGNDTFVLGDSADTVSDSGGTDTITSTISRGLGTAIENLTLLGSAKINGTGNAGQNIIIGNAASNVLNGLGGADLMRGGRGNDFYYVDHAGDVADESMAASSGVDTVLSKLKFSLADTVHAKGVIENLTLIGTSSVAGTGNAQANVIKGNAGANTLTGLVGNDTLFGLAGSDILIGGLGRDIQTGHAGNDIFRFASVGESTVGALRDVILDFDKLGNDRIDLSAISPVVLTYMGAGAFTGINQVRIVDIAGPHVMVEVNRTGSLAADMQILLANTTLASMSKGDFIL